MAKLKKATRSEVDLLQHAGIKTFGELAGFDPDKLYVHLEKIIEQKKLSVRLPRKEKLSEWKVQAKCELAGDIIIKPKP